MKKNNIAICVGKLFLLVIVQLLSLIYSYGQVSWNIEPSCSGSNTGRIELTVDINNPLSPAPPFNIVWSDSDGIPIPAEFEDPNAGISIVSGLAIGEYCVFIISLTDGCTSDFCGLEVDGMVIESITPTCICPAPPNASYTPYGALNVEVSGNSTYTYAWSGTGQISNPTIQNPLVYATGTYSVTVTDSQTGCTVSGEVTVGECQVDLQSLVQVVPDCNEEGTSTLSIQLPTGYGVGPFEFRWLKDGIELEFDPSSNGFASLEHANEGEYCLKILTLNGCDIEICDIQVKHLPAPKIVYEIKPIENGNDGGITLSVSGNPGPFSYLWNTGATTSSINNISEGNYLVTVTDDGSGCTSTAQIKVYSCWLLNAYLSLNGIYGEVTPMSSGGGGAINVQVSDTYPGYVFDFNWSNGEHTEDVNNLVTPGIYTVTVTEANCGMSWIARWEICNFTVDIKAVEWQSCTEVLLEAVVQPAGNYDYEWYSIIGNSDDPTFVATAGMGACVTVTNTGSNCFGNVCIVPQLNGEDIEISLVDLQNDTYGLPANGLITVSAAGGLPPDYQYLWSNGASGPSITMLKAGIYTVTVTDNCGNSNTSTFNIQCEILESSILGQVSNVSCTDNHGGSIELILVPFQHGHGPIIEYEWSNGATTKNIYGLAVGEYCVTITEVSTGCIGFNCFEIEKEGDASFDISFLTNPSCYPLSNGEITAIASDTSLGPFQYSWTTYDWGSGVNINLGNTETIENVPAGWFTVYMTDAIGCTASDYTLMWPAPPAFTVAAAFNPYVVCDGGTGIGVIQVTSGIPPVSPTYTWANQNVYPTTYINTNGSNTLTGLELGTWTVTVTGNKGCQAFTWFRVEESLIQVERKVDVECNTASIQLIPYTGTGSYPPFSYTWSDGVTTKDRTNLDEGVYTVTVTDAMGCSKVLDAFNIEYLDLQLLVGSTIINNGCSSNCSGEITLNINPDIPNISIQWDGVNYFPPDHRTHLCAGSYNATISAQGCEKTYTFTVGQAGDEPFDYEVEVLHYFGNEIGPNPNGYAKIKILSDLFQPKSNSIQVSTSSQMTPNIATANTLDGYTIVFISTQHSNTNTFYFTYTALNGCVYSGSFDGIPTCEPGEHFNFVVEHVGSYQGSCGHGQNHAYNIDSISAGQNYPYFIEVTMLEASDSTESDFKKIVEYTGQNPFIIDGIPAGNVQFKSYSLCKNPIYITTHVNCCESFSCDLISEGQYDDNLYWDFPYFRIIAKNWLDCFDGCGSLEFNCPKVSIDPWSVTSPFNCWTGKVIISYPNGSKYIINVIENGSVDIVEHDSGSAGDWDPSDAGDYVLNISYIGDGLNNGVNCSTSIAVNLYGPSNYNDAIVFLDNFWFFNFVNIPQNFEDAYYGTATCGVCLQDENYYFGSDNDDACENSGQSEYFNFTPTIITGSNPCASGGTLEFLDFDDNGEVVMNSLFIPAQNMSDILIDHIGPVQLLQPFGYIGTDTFCTRYGFCLFEPNFLPFPIYDVNLDKPLLVQWVDEEFCKPTDTNDFSSPNFDPCGPGNECEGDLVCYEGACYPPCIDGECQEGFCEQVVVNGVSLYLCTGNQGGDGCSPPCSENEVCDNGICHPANNNICDFSDIVTTGVGKNNYYFYHNLPKFSSLRFYYERQSLPDEIFIIGSGLNEHIDCGPDTDWHYITITTTEPPPNIIGVSVVPCPEETESKYSIRFCCQNCLNNPPLNELSSIGGFENNKDCLSVFPNPFSSNFISISIAIEEAFEGQMSLFDNFGREVVTREYVFAAGENVLQLDGLVELAEGLYLIQIKKEGKIYAAQKIIKSK